MLFSSINRFSSRQFRSSSSIASALLLMDLGGVRRKMVRKHCERINALKTVNGYFFKRWYAVGQHFFPTVWKLYIDAYCKHLMLANTSGWPWRRKKKEEEDWRMMPYMYINRVLIFLYDKG